MDRPTTPHEFAVQRLDEAGWILVADRLIHGICHDLNGRAGSISSLIYLLDSGEEPTSVTAILEEESLKLEEDVRLLRLLPDDAEEPETLAPGELLSSLARMVPIQRGFESLKVEVTIPPTAPAVRMDLTLFVRVLLLLLSGAAEEAGRSGEPLVRVTGMAAESALRIGPARAEVNDAQGSTPRTWAGALPAVMEARIEEVLAEAGGGLNQVEGPAGTTEWEVRFPEAP